MVMLPDKKHTGGNDNMEKFKQMRQQNNEKLQQLNNKSKSEADISQVIANAAQYNVVNLDTVLSLMGYLPNGYNWFIREVLSMMARDKFNNPELDNLRWFCADLVENNSDLEDVLYDHARIPWRDYTDGDDYAYTYYELYEMADEDLKANGMNANALYWYDEMREDTIHVFNGYANGFYTYDTMDEYLNDYIPQYDNLINDLIEYLAE